LPSRSHFVPTQPRVAVAEGRKEQSKFRTRWISGRAAGERKKEETFRDFHRGGGSGDRRAAPISNLEILDGPLEVNFGGALCPLLRLPRDDLRAR